MKKSKVKITKKTKLALVSVAIVLVFLTACLFIVDSLAPANPKVYHKFLISTFVGSVDGEESPNTYHQITIHKDAQTGEKQYTCVNVKAKPVNNAAIKEIWINISDLYADNLTVFVGEGITSKTTQVSERTYSKEAIKKDNDGWFRIYNNEAGKARSVYEYKIGFSSEVKFRELVIIDVNDKKATIEVDSCSIGAKPEANEATAKHEKTPKSTAININDEQDTFIK